MHIIFVDIDGTLIKINSAGRQVMKSSLSEVYGTHGPIDDFSFVGVTDVSIVQNVMAAAGFGQEEIRAGMPDLFRVMNRLGREIFFENGLEPCVGVPELLDEISARPGVSIGLITGNSSSTAKLKLEAAGIRPELFEIGSYGSDAQSKNEIAAIAWRRAEDRLKFSQGGTQAYMVGDTPADVHCGRFISAKTIAVATGGCSKADLASCHPDLLLDDLSNTKGLINFLFGQEGDSYE